MGDGRVGAAHKELGNKLIAEAELLQKCLGCTAEGQQSFSWLACKYLFGL